VKLLSGYVAAQGEWTNLGLANCLGEHCRGPCDGWYLRVVESNSTSPKDTPRGSFGNGSVALPAFDLLPGCCFIIAVRSSRVKFNHESQPVPNQPPNDEARAARAAAAPGTSVERRRGATGAGCSCASCLAATTARALAPFARAEMGSVLCGGPSVPAAA